MNLFKKPSAQPPPGGARNPYRVVGVWMPDGTLETPKTNVVLLSDNRETRQHGDIIWMTRQEAAVVAKKVALEPLKPGDVDASA